MQPTQELSSCVTNGFGLDDAGGHALLSAEKTIRQRAASCGGRPHRRAITHAANSHRCAPPSGVLRSQKTRLVLSNWASAGDRWRAQELSTCARQDIHQTASVTAHRGAEIDWSNRLRWFRYRETDARKEIRETTSVFSTEGAPA